MKQEIQLTPEEQESILLLDPPNRLNIMQHLMTLALIKGKLINKEFTYSPSTGVITYEAD